MNPRIALAVLSTLLPWILAASPVARDATMQEIIALEEEWARAENAKDADGLRTIIDERALVISDRGVRSRDQFIASVTGGEVDPTQTQTLSDRAVVIDGDTAVSTLIDTLRGTRDGKPYEITFRCTSIFVRRDSRWLVIAEVFNKASTPAKSD